MNRKALLTEILTEIILGELLQEKKKKTSGKKKKGGWMANLKIKTGALSRSLGIPEKEDISVSLLKSKKKELQKKGEGPKKLSKSDLTLLRRINFALTLKGMSKKKANK